MRSAISSATARTSKLRNWGTTPLAILTNVKSSSVLARSSRMASATPGYCTLTATSVPSCRRAVCTCPIDAAAMGSGENSAKSCSGGRPSSLSMTTSLAIVSSAVFTEAMPATSSPTRERLLDEAMRLFGERGYDATSVAEIERSVGLTPGAGGLFHHFRTKEAVLVAGIDRHLARLEAVRQVPGAIPPLGDLA